MSWIEEAKRRVALKAVEHVKDGFVVGLGSGSTAAYAIKELGRRVKEEDLTILGVATSHQSALLALDVGIPLTSLNEHPEPDIAVDGADEIDPNLDAIKGGGGAMTMEKIVGSAAKHLILIADSTKLVHKLGDKNPVPVEVLPYALNTAILRIRRLGGDSKLRLAERKVGPVITDNGNFIIDVTFAKMEEPKRVDMMLNSIPGVVETGLFIDLVDKAYIGGTEEIEELTRH